MDFCFLNDIIVWFFLFVNYLIYVFKYRCYRVVSNKCYSIYREKLFYRGDIVNFFVYLKCGFIVIYLFYILFKNL